jgi:hypothetical protein
MLADVPHKNLAGITSGDSLIWKTRQKFRDGGIWIFFSGGDFRSKSVHLFRANLIERESCHQAFL